MNTQIPLSTLNVDTLRIQYAAIVGSALLFLFIFELTRKGAIRIPYSLLWFFLSAGFLLISIRRDFLEQCAILMGVAYAPAALFLILILGIIGILIHFSIVLSTLSDRTAKLVQELAALRLEMNNQATSAPPPVETRDSCASTTR